MWQKKDNKNKGQDRGNFQLIFRVDGNENINWKTTTNKIAYIYVYIYM